jgi:hypothetical protein
VQILQRMALYFLWAKKIPIRICVAGTKSFVKLYLSNVNLIGNQKLILFVYK